MMKRVLVGVLAGLTHSTALAQQANVNLDYNPQKNTEGLVPFSAPLNSPDVRDAAGTLWLAVTNVDPNRSVDIAARLSGINGRTATGETLTAPAVDSVNTFEAPRAVVPKPVAAKLMGDELTLTLEPKSVTVLSIRR